MQSRRTNPPEKAYYKLVDGVWQRCFASDAQMVVCVTSPMQSTFNEFMYAIDLRSQTKITDLSEIAAEIQVDLCFGVPLPAMRTGGIEQPAWYKHD